MTTEARPVTAPRTVPSGQGWMLAFAGFTFFTLFAGDFWRYSISWYGWGIVVALCLAGSIVFLVRARPRVPIRTWPKTLLLFLLLCIASIAWSSYRGASVLGTIAQLATAIAGVFFALCLTWHQVLRALGAALRWIVALSLVFELFVSVFIRHHILPFWVHYPAGKLPDAYYWSRDLLFHGGKIQGIVGNSDILGMITLYALIVFGIQLAERTVNRTAGIVWVVLAAVTFLLTRSSTVIVALLVTCVVLLFVWWTRSVPQGRRVPVYVTGAVVVAAGAASIVLFWGTITSLLGKGADLTGRTNIWAAVIHLAQQKPAFGWGWVSYWVPWAEPFKGLAIRNGVEYLQAHNAYLDVWLQLGIVGLVVFVLLVLSTFGRSWFMAVDRAPFDGAGVVRPDVPYTAISLLPLLMMSAAIAQSFTESRMLIEIGFALLVLFSVKTKLERP
ncbi:O-antigen ligase family protein [Humibacter ginsenosidimutans]|uniref:O-antigen ligase family protein n=1 Tax=Humibacter ginsenosidimutans TaxID=2599293 RepID=A0A5B8MAB2_9MICO|nr:O-antigen ligase family protein [Humibacter ginsenosidimutans]QDZ16450.1 O-antigen ligase family protein [Humibacter ginsenosidimutans]